MADLIVLMGPTGAGKSAQGDLLAAKHNWLHLSSGTLLRQDPHAAALMVDGRLAPAAEVERVVGGAMAAADPDQTIVLDGTPRTNSNVQWLDDNLARLKRVLRVVILIELDLVTSLRRLALRGRADDAPQAVREKWDLFDRITRPVVDHYRRLGLLKTVDGRGTIEQVHEQIEDVLKASLSL